MATKKIQKILSSGCSIHVVSKKTSYGELVAATHIMCARCCDKHYIQPIIEEIREAEEKQINGYDFIYGIARRQGWVIQEYPDYPKIGDKHVYALCPSCVQKDIKDYMRAMEAIADFANNGK